MLLCLARSGTATHTDILDRATETGHFVTLEVSQADKHIGVHNGSADLCILNIFTADNGNFNIVRTLESVTNDDGTTNGERSKTIFPSALKMLKRIFSASGIHGVAVRKERLTTKLFDYVNNSARIVGAQITDITKLTEMKLDRNEFAVEIKICKSCRFDQSFQFCGQSLTKLRTKIRKIYFCFFHRFFSNQNNIAVSGHNTKLCLSHRCELNILIISYFDEYFKHFDRELQEHYFQ